MAGGKGGPRGGFAANVIRTDVFVSLMSCFFSSTHPLELCLGGDLYPFFLLFFISSLDVLV